MKLLQEHIDFIEMNLSIFRLNNAATQEQRVIVYDIYNHITGMNKKVSSCGRCWRNVKQRVMEEYKKQNTEL